MGFGLAEKWLVYQRELREEHKDGAKVGCLIMKKLRKLGLDNGIDVVIFPLYGSLEMDDRLTPESNRKHREVLTCAQTEGLTVVRTHELLARKFGPNEKNKEKALSTYWGHPEDGHLSATGTRFVAEYLAAQIRPLIQNKMRDR